MIGFICALDVEIDGIRAMMTDPQHRTIARITYYSGRIGSVDVVCCECGVGKVNAAIATQIMIDCYQPDGIINSGIAGSLSQKIAIGDIVISKDCVQHDMDGTEMGDPPGEIWYNDGRRLDIPADERVTALLQQACEGLGDTRVFVGRIATGDTFVSLRSRRERIASMFSALACEMEGGAVAQVCYRNGVPFSVLRCISDDYNENELVDFVKFRSLSAEKTICVIRRFLQLIEQENG